MPVRWWPYTHTHTYTLSHSLTVIDSHWQPHSKNLFISHFWSKGKFVMFNPPWIRLSWRPLCLDVICRVAEGHEVNGTHNVYFLQDGGGEKMGEETVGTHLGKGINQKPHTHTQLHRADTQAHRGSFTVSHRPTIVSLNGETQCASFFLIYTFRKHMTRLATAFCNC